ncbi:MAG: hypothetical protein JKY56_22395 [Kofleriaceae bacterium]|nr:hypothetical protein [Kofleriaceae bacterium]
MIRFALVSIFVVSTALACGASSPAGPSALSWHYDEVYIAQLSLDEKAKVLSAQNLYQRARAEQMKAAADLSESSTELNVSKNEQKQSLLSERSASQQKKAAEDSGDMTRINQASKAMRIAELTRRSADEKISYLNANRKYLQKYLLYCQEETYHREARYEHEKAKLGQSKNIAPKGIQYDKFSGQTAQRSKQSQIAKQRAKNEKQKADQVKAVWQKRVQETNQSRGVPSSSTSSSSES